MQIEFNGAFFARTMLPAATRFEFRGPELCCEGRRIASHADGFWRIADRFFTSARFLGRVCVHAAHPEREDTRSEGPLEDLCVRGSWIGADTRSLWGLEDDGLWRRQFGAREPWATLVVLDAGAP